MTNQAKPPMHKVTIYSDGGCQPNPGTGGFGAILIYGALEKEISGGAAQTTNNRMELTAACAALEALNQACEVEFYTDSKYVQQGITQWLPRWIKNGWRTASKKPVENKDLWLRLYMEAKRHTIQWKWVKGHAGNDYNERCDKLATAARLAVAITEKEKIS